MEMVEVSRLNEAKAKRPPPPPPPPPITTTTYLCGTEQHGLPLLRQYPDDLVHILLFVVINNNNTNTRGLMEEHEKVGLG